MPTSTEIFINSELPKRPYTNQFPFTSGHVPVATGVGLQVEARALTAADISDMSSYATQNDLSNVLAGLWDDRGAYTVNAAGNINYPSSAGSGVEGALMKGDIFTVAGAVAGVSKINNIAVNNGDTVRALVDNPSATDNAHWAIAENNIGYVPENTANKTTDTDLSGAAGTYPDTPTVKSYIDNYDISAASISSTGTVTLTRAESDLTFQVPTAISGLSFDANTGVLTSSYTNDALDTTITVAANEVADNVFRIKDNTDATKKIAFEAGGIGTGQTRTISCPNFDVSLSPIRRRAQTASGGLENLLLDNTETYIDIVGGATITVPVYPSYTSNAGASGYLFNVTSMTKTIRFQHTWSGEIPSFVGGCRHYFPETNESGGYTSTGPGSSGNTYSEIQLLPGETLRFAVGGTKSDCYINIYRNSSNVMYDNTFKIKRSALESHGVRFETSAVTGDKVITMPNSDVNLGNVAQAASAYTAGYLTNTDWSKFNGKEESGYITVSSNFTAELGKKYRTVWGLNSAITITPPVTNVDGAHFTVFYSYMTPTGSVTCTNPNISASQINMWQEYEYTYDAVVTGWISLRKSLGPVVPAGSYFQLRHPTNYNSSCIFQLADATSSTIINVPASTNIDLGNVAQAATTSTNGYLTNTDWDTFNNKLGLVDVRYVFLNDPTTTQTTYTVPASAVTAAGRTIIELSNNSLTSITINAATGTGKVAGDSVNISITGTYAAQVLDAGAGVTLQGDLTFSYQYETKTLVYKGSNVWKVVG